MWILTSRVYRTDLTAAATTPGRRDATYQKPLFRSIRSVYLRLDLPYFIFLNDVTEFFFILHPFEFYICSLYQTLFSL